MKDITHFIIEDKAKARPTGDLQNFQLFITRKKLFINWLNN